MAAITGAVVGGSALLGAYESGQARNAAERAARRQAEGVESAQQQTIEATNLARGALSGLAPVSAEQQQLQSQLDQLISQQGQTQAPTGVGRRGFNIQDSTPIPSANTGGVFAPEGVMGGKQITALQNQISALDAQREQAPDPRQELLGGIGGQLDFTGQGFAQSQDVISPLAQMAQPYLQEQQALLGLGGDQAYQDALSRVSDPLRAEQERAIMRNNAALGGVGGNVLSQLAEQTRARTEANIGNRLNQISQANAPALNALQQISNLRLNRGLSMADIMGGGGRDLAAQETARRQALANVELGQGSELAQLAQNLGTARSGGAAFAAQNPSPLTAGLTAGLNAFTGMGGMSMFGGGGAAPMGGTVNPNRFGNIA